MLYVFNVFRVLTNHNFSPPHRVIADIFGSFLEYIVVLIFSLNNIFNQYLDIEYKGLYITISMIAYVIIVWSMHCTRDASCTLFRNRH